ncbi:MAG: cobalamin B12-binding domain-containing protein [Planctomycetes bacterium]|nr:cobalamin B12-binding domain-containing protein [Planctomycetota bacterium]
MARSGPIRILLAKPGLDGHDRGIRLVLRALRDAGMEVIYTGLRATADQIVKAAIEEDVDAIGLSSLSGAHETHFIEVSRLLAEQGASDVLLFGGGIIPQQDVERLRGAGFQCIYPPGTSLKTIVADLKSILRQEPSSGGNTS